MSITAPRWPIIDNIDLSAHDHSGATPSSDPSQRLATKDRRRTVFYRKDAADGAAATATTELGIGELPLQDAGTVTAIRVVADSAVTANATDFATFNVYKRTSAGASQTLLANFTTAATSLNAFSSQAMSLQSAALSMAAGSVLTFEITKSGAGVVIPPCFILVDYTVN